MILWQRDWQQRKGTIKSQIYSLATELSFVFCVLRQNADSSDSLLQYSQFIVTESHCKYILAICICSFDLHPSTMKHFQWVLQGMKANRPCQICKVHLRLLFQWCEESRSLGKGWAADLVEWWARLRHMLRDLEGFGSFAISPPEGLWWSISAICRTSWPFITCMLGQPQAQDRQHL